MAVIGQRCAQAKPSKEVIPTSRIGADPCDTEHRLETSQGAGESRETNTETGEQDMLNEREGTYPQKKELREAKRRSAEKNKSKSISMEK
jgi:hypothetical protein